MCLHQVLVQMEPSESYEVLQVIPAANLPYSQPGSCYNLVRLPEDDPTAGMWLDRLSPATDFSHLGSIVRLLALTHVMRNMAKALGRTPALMQCLSNIHPCKLDYVIQY